MEPLDVTSGWVGEVIDPGVLGDNLALVWDHYHRYPQHPLCKRRVYWKLTTDAEKDEDGQLRLCITYKLLEVGVHRYRHMYTVYVGKEDNGPEVVKAESHWTDIHDYPDPVQEIFGGEIFEDLASEVGEHHEFIVVVERLHIEKDGDWEILEKQHLFTIQGEDEKGKYLEVVQILAEGKHLHPYSPFPRYPYA